MRPNEITVLPIPEGVTEITEKEAFPCRADLKCVQIPDGVVKIGDNAFLVAGFRLLGFLTLKTGILSLLSLYLLYQIDGNYYMLLYALTGMLESIVLYARAAYEVSPAGRPYRRFFSGESNYGLLLLTAVMLYFTAFTGWAGPVGFTPIDPVNRVF